MVLVPTQDAAEHNPTPRCRAVLQLAREQASRHGHRYLGVEHIMLAILEDRQSVPAQVLSATSRPSER
jgi:ATP-dependent Clp protease ATP-binding subunit ClpA